MTAQPPPSGPDHPLTPPLTPPPGGPPTRQPEPAPTPARSTIGRIALVAAIVGLVFACIPGALIVGWVLLPVGFVLGVVSLFQKGSKKPGTWAIVLSIVGTIIATIVFLVVVSAAVDDALGGTDSSVSPAETSQEPDAPASPDGEESGDEAGSEDGDGAGGDDAPAAEVGTRENPAPLGSVVSGSEWDVTITSFELDATEAVLAANQFNEPPADGMVYAVVGVSATYTGADSSTSLMVGVDYVTATGEVVTRADSMAVAPDPMFGMAELFQGGTDTGNVVLQVPADGGGVLRVSPGMFVDPVFVATS